MILIALLLMAAAAALTLGVIVGSTDAARLDVVYATAETTVAGVFVAGVVAGLVFLFGLVLFQAALRRGRRRRQERKAAERERERTVQELEQEKQEIAAEKQRLEQQLSTSRPPHHAATNETPPRT